ncbi:hypothetical protein [Massilia aerilata]|uniref:Uncharacterized protein n=1 Tax=Massilia aerilata TaxID=453817 RepID=A0ABW0RZK2_9BURK
MSMKEFLQHMKEVAIADSKLFIEPYVAIYNFIKRDFNRTAVKN